MTEKKLQNYCAVLEYDGRAYYGWQIQRNGQITIQEKLEQAISQVIGTEAKVTGSGRTDTGVHALGQVANFKIKTKIPPEKLVSAINHYLPQDIVVRKIEKVPLDFHARFQAKRKLYSYQIWNDPIFSPLRCCYATWIRQPLLFDLMEKAAEYLRGTHDFSAFASKKDPEKSGIRTIYRADLKKRESMLIFEIEGSGFLYNMVRAIMGTLIEVGFEKKSLGDFQQILHSKKRESAGATAPPEGLCLVQVLY